jgi:hypothetical protein
MFVVLVFFITLSKINKNIYAKNLEVSTSFILYKTKNKLLIFSRLTIPDIRQVVDSLIHNIFSSYEEKEIENVCNSSVFFFFLHIIIAMLVITIIIIII